MKVYKVKNELACLSILSYIGRDIFNYSRCKMIHKHPVAIQVISERSSLAFGLNMEMDPVQVLNLTE
jgi:hypothetical protein